MTRFLSFLLVSCERRGGRVSLLTPDDIYTLDLFRFRWDDRRPGAARSLDDASSRGRMIDESSCLPPVLIYNFSILRLKTMKLNGPTLSRSPSILDTMLPPMLVTRRRRPYPPPLPNPCRDSRLCLLCLRHPVESHLRRMFSDQCLPKSHPYKHGHIRIPRGNG